MIRAVTHDRNALWAFNDLDLAVDRVEGERVLDRTLRIRNERAAGLLPSVGRILRGRGA